MDAFSDRLKWFRQKAGMEVSDLASVSGIAEATLEDMEAGKRRVPTINQLGRISEALSCSAMSLVHKELTEAALEVRVAR